MRWTAVQAILFVSWCLCGLASADQFTLETSKAEGKQVVIAKILLQPGEPRLELFWKNENNLPLKTFESLQSWLAQKKRRTLLFATNGGIYRDTPSYAPIGLHVEHGRRLVPLSFARGCGNFCWYSGMFLIRNDEAEILPREQQLPALAAVRLALQSGPLLMRNGNLQGSWSKQSYNANRSAICSTAKKNEVWIALVPDRTNFDEFFAVLKSTGCRNALFLDGEVSSFFDGKKRIGNPFTSYAGILAITEPARP